MIDEGYLSYPALVLLEGGTTLPPEAERARAEAVYVPPRGSSKLRPTVPGWPARSYEQIFGTKADGEPEEP